MKNRFKHSEETKKKISLACIGKKHPRGEKSHRWKGGKSNRGKFITVYIREHPNCDANGYYSEHRYVCEISLGRYLTREEVPHHIDGNKSNNKTENLYLFSNHSKHMKYHWAVRKNNIEPITKSNLII